MTNIKLFLLIGTSLSLISMNAYAESCAATPDCKSLGYTETSCPDGGGVKCPWNTSLMYCCKKSAACELKSCQVGDVLYSDKKCYSCLSSATAKQPPIGVVFATGKAVGLVDLSTKTTWSEANTLCNNYNYGAISGWYLPSKDELLQIHANINVIQTGLLNVGGDTKLSNDYHWSSSVYSAGHDEYWIVNPVNGSSTSGNYNPSRLDVRPVLAF